jgi:hypothetical protein
MAGRYALSVRSRPQPLTSDVPEWGRRPTPLSAPLQRQGSRATGPGRARIRGGFSDSRFISGKGERGEAQVSAEARDLG